MFFTEEHKKIALCPNDDKRIKSVNSVETCAHRTSTDLVYKKEKTICSNMVKQC